MKNLVIREPRIVALAFFISESCLNRPRDFTVRHSQERLPIKNTYAGLMTDHMMATAKKFTNYILCVISNYFLIYTPPPL